MPTARNPVFYGLFFAFYSKRSVLRTFPFVNIEGKTESMMHKDNAKPEVLYALPTRGPSQSRGGQHTRPANQMGHKEEHKKSVETKNVPTLMFIQIAEAGA